MKPPVRPTPHQLLTPPAASLGAHKTVVFASRIRNLATDTNQRADNRAPAFSIHSDFTPAGATQMLTTTLAAQVPDAAAERGRPVFVNVWRPLKPIQRDPLAVCDWASVDAAADRVPLRFTFPSGWSELAKWRRRDGHRWVYLSGQTPEEPLVFVQWDSAAGPGGKTVAHSAFEDAEFADAEARESIEIKMVAFVE